MSWERYFMGMRWQVVVENGSAMRNKNFTKRMETLREYFIAKCKYTKWILNLP